MIRVLCSIYFESGAITERLVLTTSITRDGNKLIFREFTPGCPDGGRKIETLITNGLNTYSQLSHQQAQICLQEAMKHGYIDLSEYKSIIVH